MEFAPGAATARRAKSAHYSIGAAAPVARAVNGRFPEWFYIYKSKETKQCYFGLVDNNLIFL
ncbi:MAG: hypothetical protein Q4A98_08165 [Comamonadaceae bacterium]|nr:hypothetical protein [Comamonadaceae bacterium]